MQDYLSGLRRRVIEKESETILEEWVKSPAKKLKKYWVWKAAVELPKLLSH